MKLHFGFTPGWLAPTRWRMQGGLPWALVLLPLALQAQPLIPSSVAVSAAPEISRWLTDAQRCREGLTLQASEPISLAMALRAAICNSTPLRQSSGTVQQARAALERSRSSRQPSLSLSTGVEGARNEPGSAGAELNLEWVLFDFGASSAAQQEARLALQAALDDQGSEVLVAVAQAVQLYTATQAALWQLEAGGLNVRTALETQRIARARQEAGAASQLDKLQADTALAQAKLEHSRATNAWLSARGELALVMGLPASQALVLMEAVDDTNTRQDEALVDAATLVQEARANHPRVAAARARHEQALARVSGFESQRWGRVNLAASTSAARSLSSGGGNRNDVSGSMRWSLPLLDRGVLQSQIAEAQGAALVRAAEIEESERQTSLQVWQEAQALQGERSALRAVRSLLEAAEAGLRVAAERVRLGVGSFSDMVQAQSALSNARLQWAQTRANLSRAQWRLAAATGRLSALQVSLLRDSAPVR